MAYSYSPEGRVIQSEMSSERTESYTYTPNGNLAAITSDGKIFDYDYYDTDLIKCITYPNGLKTEYIYDNIGRVTSMLTSMNNATITALSYIYDNNGNVLSVTQNGETTAYTYDSLNRLLSVTYADSSFVTYTYDALNNLTKETFSNGDVKDYVYNEKNQLATVKLNGEVTDSYTYNKTGAVTSHNDKVFTYNQWDTLSSFIDGDATYTYIYDANGIRTQENNKQYIVDIYNNVVAETDDNGTINAEILWGNDKPLARKVGSVWYYYIYNAHGDVVQLIDNSGNIVNTYDYDIWGNFLDKTETIDNPFTYFGQTYDETTGLYYLRARYYDPSTGRFTQQDPAEDSYNWYVYGGNNPITYVDPSGLSSWVFYDGNAFSEQAKTEASNLENKYGTKTNLIDIWSLDGFLYNWNNMINTDKSIDGVSMLFHGSPYTMYLGEDRFGNAQQLTSSTKNITPNGSEGYYVGNLRKASIKAFNLMTCNGGHLDLVYAYKAMNQKGFYHNIAVEFLVTQDVQTVYAMDGSLAYTELFGNFYPRLAWNQNDYKSWTPSRRFLGKRSPSGKNMFWINGKGGVDHWSIWE